MYDKDSVNKEKYEINYVAVLEMVTEIALEGGDIKSYMTADYFTGLVSKPYKKVKENHTGNISCMDVDCM